MATLQALFNAAQNLRRAQQHFQQSTQFSAGKANEVLAACIVNTWLAQRQLPYHIDISNKPRGADGALRRVDAPENAQAIGAVEFKSTAKKEGRFQFTPEFLHDKFAEHCMVVMSELPPDAAQWRVFIALSIGTPRKALNALHAAIECDCQRSSFRAEKHHNPQIGASAKPQDAQPSHTGRWVPQPGLYDLLGTYGCAQDVVAVIEGEELLRILQTLQPPSAPTQ